MEGGSGRWQVKSIENMVSVIIPAYNAENSIERAVQSVLGQTYSNLECVVVNDGSTDATDEILGRLKKADGRVVACRVSNGGVSAARNKGLALAHGEFAAFLDSDDRMEKDMLEKLVKGMKEGNAQMAVCGYAMQTGETQEHFPMDGISVDFCEGQEMAEVFQTLVVGYYMHAVWNKLYQRNLIDFVFDTKVSLGEDFLFNLQYMEHVKTLSLVRQELYHYNRGQGGKTLTDQMPANRLYVVKENYQRAVRLYERCGGSDSKKLRDACARQCIAVLAGLNRIEGSSWKKRKVIISDCFSDAFLWPCLKNYHPEAMPLRLAMWVFRLKMGWLINGCHALLPRQ